MNKDRRPIDLSRLVYPCLLAIFPVLGIEFPIQNPSMPKRSKPEKEESLERRLWKMFVQSEKFIEAHSDHYLGRNGKKLAVDPKDRISIYGQESNQTTWRLAKMNLAIRGIDSSNVKWNNEGSFLNDAHKDLKADFVIANPPFNDSDWSISALGNGSAECGF